MSINYHSPPPAYGSEFQNTQLPPTMGPLSRRTCSARGPPPTGPPGSSSGQQREGVHLWHKIREYAVKVNSCSPPTEHIRPACPVCDDDLSIAGLGRPNCTDSAHDNDSHKCKVFPCGHVLCRECTKSLFKASSMNAEGVRGCPICRCSLQCTECRAPSKVVTAPSHRHDVSQLRIVPKTIPEGAVVQARCVPCRADQEFRELMAKDPHSSKMDQVFATYAFQARDRATNAGMSVLTVTNLVTDFERRAESRYLFLITERKKFIDSRVRRAAAEASPDDGMTSWF